MVLPLPKNCLLDLLSLLMFVDFWSAKCIVKQVVTLLKLYGVAALGDSANARSAKRKG